MRRYRWNETWRKRPQIAFANSQPSSRSSVRAMSKLVESPGEFLLRLYRQGILVRPARGVYALAESSVTETSQSRGRRKTRSSRRCLPPVGPSVPRPHDPGPARGLDSNRLQSPQAVCRVAGTQSGAVLWPGPRRRNRGARDRGNSSPRLRRGEDVADCFKYRHKIGIDVAIEALRDALRSKKAAVDEIHRFAKVCRVANVIRPYLESAV